MNLLIKKIKEIEMPDDMRKRTIERCNKEISDMKKWEDEGKMKVLEKNRNSMKGIGKEKNFWKKQLQVAATLVLCVCITGVTALAATGKVQGFFKDIKNWNGAVVGTSYEHATEEIAVSIGEVGEELNISVMIVNPENPPYRESEVFGIESYRIEDMEGNVIVSENSFGERMLYASQMLINIPLNDISSGKYKLVIEQFVSEKKADQPLGIYGNWECEFEY